MTELCELAKKYGTDKLGVYTPFYDALLGFRRGMLFQMLEIGIGHPAVMKHVPGYQAGASLRMWRSYFPYARIFGIDINSAAIAEMQEREDSERIVVGEWSLLDQFPDVKFNLIVDDGSHQPEDQLHNLRRLMPRLMQNGLGLYIIEDVDDLQALSKEIPYEHTLIQHPHKGLVGRAIVVYGS